jgi:hypothetical protein
MQVAPEENNGNSEVFSFMIRFRRRLQWLSHLSTRGRSPGDRRSSSLIINPFSRGRFTQQNDLPALKQRGASANGGP